MKMDRGKRLLTCQKCGKKYAFLGIKNGKLQEYYPFCSRVCHYSDLFQWLVTPEEIHISKEEAC